MDGWMDGMGDVKGMELKIGTARYDWDLQRGNLVRDRAFRSLTRIGMIRET